MAAVAAVDAIDPDQLTPQSLSAWLAEAVSCRTVRDAVNLDGLMHIGDLAAEEIASRTAGAERFAAPAPTLNETRTAPHVR